MDEKLKKAENDLNRLREWYCENTDLDRSLPKDFLEEFATEYCDILRSLNDAQLKQIAKHNKVARSILAQRQKGFAPQIEQDFDVESTILILENHLEKSIIENS